MAITAWGEACDYWNLRVNRQFANHCVLTDEPLLIAPTMTAFVSMRYFRNDKGETFAERGIGRVRLRGWKRTGLRFVAIVGMVNCGFLVYQVPAVVIGMYSSPWPDDIVTRSYFNPGLCDRGPNTPAPDRPYP